MQAVRSLKAFWSSGVHQFFQVAFGIKERTLIVKTVSEFMTDDCANTAEIDGIVSLEVIERRLQNAGGKVDVVFGGIVVGIDVGGVICHSRLSRGCQFC